MEYPTAKPQLVLSQQQLTNTEELNLIKVNWKQRQWLVEDTKELFSKPLSAHQQLMKKSITWPQTKIEH